MGSETRKLLLIGSTGYGRAKDGLRLDCVSWDKLSNVQNVRDYDVLLLNLLSIGTEAARKEVDWAKFNELLDFPAASDILTHKGRIVVLGDPRFEIPKRKETGTMQFLDWTGATFAWDGQPGDTVKFSESYEYREFKDYAKYLRRWNYSLARCSLNKSVFGGKWDLEALSRKAVNPIVNVYAACSNRYGHALAFYIQHFLKNRVGHTSVPYGSIYLLPETISDEDETLLIVLRDFCDAASELPEPEWISGFSVPGQKQIDDNIAQIKVALAEKQAALEKTTVERTKARVCLKLLYEREFALEPVVRDMLSQLGATIEEPG